MKKLFLIFALVFILSGSAFAAERKEYTVKVGDTLSGIAWFLKIDRAQLLEWNSELGVNTPIQPGDVIVYFVEDPAAELRKTREELLGAVSGQAYWLDGRIQYGNTSLSASLETVTENQQTLADMIESQVAVGSGVKSGLEEVVIGQRVTFFFGVALALIISIAGYFILRRYTKLVKTAIKQTQEAIEERTRKTFSTKPFDLGGVSYVYEGEFDQNERYVSPFGPAYDKEADVRKSVKSYFKKNPDKMNEAILSGQLREIGHA